MRRLPCYHSVVLEVGGASWLGQVYSSFHIVLGVIEGHLLQRVMSHVINLSEGHIATSPPQFFANQNHERLGSKACNGNLLEAATIKPVLYLTVKSSSQRSGRMR